MRGSDVLALAMLCAVASIAPFSEATSTTDTTVTTTTTTAAASAADRKNVLLIVIDDMRPEFMGGYAQTEAITPNIDKFVSTATTFTRAYCQQVRFHASNFPHHTVVKPSMSLPLYSPGDLWPVTQLVSIWASASANTGLEFRRVISRDNRRRLVLFARILQKSRVPHARVWKGQLSMRCWCRRCSRILMLGLPVGTVFVYGADISLQLPAGQ